MTTATVGAALIQVRQEDLHPHPLNPRTKITKASVQDLAASIAAMGMLSPLVVRPRQDGGYEVVAGHRRLVALQVIGDGREVPCLARELDDRDALVVMLSENDHHEDVDTMREAKAVGRLLELYDDNAHEVAEQMGRGVRWVASRRSLLDMSPGWRKRFTQMPWAGWPVWSIEQICKLSPDAQDAFWDQWGDYHDLNADRPSQTWLTRVLGEWMMALGNAPFPLKDADLVPKAGACHLCPKTSLSAPGLFDDGPEGDVNSATCRDRTCWQAKARAQMDANHKAMVAKVGGKKVLRIRGAHDYSRAPFGIEGAERASDWRRCKKGDRGAKPAQILTGKGAQLAWVKPAPVQRGGVASRVGKKLTLEDMEAAHAAKVSARFVGCVIDALDEISQEGAGPSLWPLLAVFGSDALLESDKTVAERQALWDGKGDVPAVFLRELWVAVRTAIMHTLYGHHGRGALDDEALALAWLCCDLLPLDRAALEAKADGEVSPTKALVAARKRAAKKSAKKSAKKRKAAKAKGGKKAAKKRVPRKRKPAPSKVGV